ncbi:MAG: porphobilinogen synthase [Pseudomonadota bacterium]
MPLPPVAPFPANRPRRSRAAPWRRAVVRETHLTASDLVQALIVREGENVAEPVASMPGLSRLSVDRIVEEARKARDLGIPALALFPHTDAAGRTPGGEEALNPGNLMCRAAEAVKRAVPEIGLIADVALDPYTDHGHDGLMRDGVILNDETVEVLVKQAVLQAEAGYDVVAPSDMMDGRVGAIRAGLEAAGLPDAIILSYAVKYASAFYGPYRDAIGSGGVLQGDKKTYQMDPANRSEALREAALDLAEGADWLMVKPGLPYLDIIREVKTETAAPVLAFQVSGEYAMIAFASAAGAIDRERAVLESLSCFRRAGTDAVISYFAMEAAGLLRSAE